MTYLGARFFCGAFFYGAGAVSFPKQGNLLQTPMFERCARVFVRFFEIYGACILGGTPGNLANSAPQDPRQWGHAHVHPIGSPRLASNRYGEKSVAEMAADHLRCASQNKVNFGAPKVEFAFGDLKGIPVSILQQLQHAGVAITSADPEYVHRRHVAHSLQKCIGAGSTPPPFPPFYGSWVPWWHGAHICCDTLYSWDFKAQGGCSGACSTCALRGAGRVTLAKD